MNDRRVNFRLYLVTDRKLFTHHPTLFAAVEDALKGGVRAVQLREKDLPARELLEMALRMREITARYAAMLFINERVDIALCAEADGVHLGQSGIPVHAARAISGDRLLIGASTHSMEEARAAEAEGAHFITFGPVYDTPSKRRYGQPVGAVALHQVSEKISIPVFGIGGITAGRVGEVMNAGAHGVALISGILGEADVEKTAAEYLRTIGESPIPLRGRGE